MKQNSFDNKRIIHAYVIAFIVIIIILIAIFLMLRYNVEGEQNPPFILKKINIISTAESDLNKDEEEVWHAGVLQKNDLFFVIEKNSDYKKEDAIRKINFENFKIIKQNENIEVNIYRPITSVNTYSYQEEYKVDKILEFVGGQSTNIELLQVNNQGGLIGFSTISKNIGEYIFSENEKLPSDGKLIAKAGVNEENIKFKLSFDLIIETTSKHKFKANIVLDLPTGNILEDGVGTFEDTELNNVVFKRI